MGNFTIATRYANALLEATEEKNTFDEVAKDMELIFNTFDASKELRVAIANPILTENKKIDILRELFGDKVGEDALEFLIFVVRKGRDEAMYDILKRFIELRDEKLGVVKVLITSAFSLDENQKEEIKKKLTEYLQKDVRMQYKVNPSLIGGFTVRVGDTVLDASVVHQLELLRNKFLKEDFTFN